MTDEPTPRKPGRSRKWATNAERSREYRRRRRTELAQPMLLLARAVELDRELRATRDELDRAHQELAATRKRLALLQESHSAARAQIEYIHEQLQQTRKELTYERGRDRLADAIRVAGYYGDDRGGVG